MVHRVLCCSSSGRLFVIVIYFMSLRYAQQLMCQSVKKLELYVSRSYYFPIVFVTSFSSQYIYFFILPSFPIFAAYSIHFFFQLLVALCRRLCMQISNCRLVQRAHWLNQEPLTFVSCHGLLSSPSRWQTAHIFVRNTADSIFTLLSKRKDFCIWTRYSFLSHRSSSKVKIFIFHVAFLSFRAHNGNQQSEAH